MDIVSSCKDKLASFRIKELKDVLTQLGLSKQGKRQDLVDKILSLLSDEEVFHPRGSKKKKIVTKESVANVIADAHRKMLNIEPAELAMKENCGIDTCSLKLTDEGESSMYYLGVKIYCPCGSSSVTESMIQCVDRDCEVHQHTECVIIPEEPMTGRTPAPTSFYCQSCRIKRADPFFVTSRHLLLPTKLLSLDIPTDGTNPVQSVEKTFILTQSDIDLLHIAEYDVQAWCMLLNDSVLFRMQWPLYADLQVNGVPVRTINRPGSQKLGVNGRDDGALITICTVAGNNRILLSGCDARTFCLGVRLVKRHTVQQVLNLIPKETDGEPFEEALARVCRCIGGGVTPADGDNDSDLKIISNSVTVNLRCPMSGSRMKIAGRFKPCIHLGCFDLETFVELNQRSRKWQCPICLKNYSVEDIIIDPYFNRITTMMQHYGEDVTEINVKPDGSWSAKVKGEMSNLAEWHLPDGSLCTTKDACTSNFKTSSHIKQEDHSESHEVNRHQHKSIIMSSSATGSSKVDEDLSINQNYNEYIDIALNDSHEIISVPQKFSPTFGIGKNNSAPLEDAEVIVLSDSEDENINLVPIKTVHNTSVASMIPNSYLDTPSSSLGLFSGYDKQHYGTEMSQLPYALSNQTELGFQLFGTDSDVSDAFIDLDNASVSCSAPKIGNTVLDSSLCLAKTSADDGLVDNPLAFMSRESSLQNILSDQPSDPLPNVIRTQDWISLKLGSNAKSPLDEFGPHIASDSGHEQEPENHFRSNEGTKDGSGSNRTDDRKMSDGPFSFPRRQRSVRQRVYLSISSD